MGLFCVAFCIILPKSVLDSFTGNYVMIYFQTSLISLKCCMYFNKYMSLNDPINKITGRCFLVARFMREESHMEAESLSLDKMSLSWMGQQALP